LLERTYFKDQSRNDRVILEADIIEKSFSYVDWARLNLASGIQGHGTVAVSSSEYSSVCRDDRSEVLMKCN